MTDRTTTGTPNYGYSKREPKSRHDVQSKGGRASYTRETGRIQQEDTEFRGEENDLEPTRNS